MDCQRLPQRLPILNKDRLDHTTCFCLDVIHHFHRFDYADLFAFGDRLANAHERSRGWSRGAVERADHWRAKRDAWNFFGFRRRRHLIEFFRMRF